MFEQFFLGAQQDLKLFICFPILCAIFRAIFIATQKPDGSLEGKGKALFQCFRFGFWWGMDINAYVFVLSLVVVTLPGLFFAPWAAHGDTIRLVLGMIYAMAIYLAFIGKQIFYAQFHDIFNNIVFLGEKAEKNNLVDVFFNQYHGARRLACIVPYAILVYFGIFGILHTPVLAYPHFAGAWAYVFNTVIVLALIAFFYFFRYGGTFMHDDKPEWDTIPDIVKDDPFLSKATVDDLIALKLLKRQRLGVTMQRSDKENLELAKPLIEATGGSVASYDDALKAFPHVTKGPKMKLPSHIFLIVGESYSQQYFDPAFADLHVADRGKAFMDDPHTAWIRTALSAGIISRPSIVSLMLGIFDAGLELNEREQFWQGTLPTSMPVQLRKLGYQTNYWYGGSMAHGNFNHFAPACGFDHAYSATDICDPDAPRSWVGVYDHIFLGKAGEMIQADQAPLQFHYLYTTSNHGPYKMPMKKLGFEAEKVLNVKDDVLKEKIIPKILGAFWYSDKAINDFIDEMKRLYPDSLFIVTGDHGCHCSELQHTSFMKREYTFRELHSPVLMFQHPNLDKDSLANNVIGGHMNILPTIMELIAPQGFTYYSLFSSLTEPVTQCVTPYHWATNEFVGGCDEQYYQKLSAVRGDDVIRGTTPFAVECEAEKSLSAYILQHPELLQSVPDLLN